MESRAAHKHTHSFSSNNNFRPNALLCGVCCSVAPTWMHCAIVKTLAQRVSMRWQNILVANENLLKYIFYSVQSTYYIVYSGSYVVHRTTYTPLSRYAHQTFVSTTEYDSLKLIYLLCAVICWYKTEWNTTMRWKHKVVNGKLLSLKDAGKNVILIHDGIARPVHEHWTFDSILIRCVHGQHRTSISKKSKKSMRSLSPKSPWVPQVQIVHEITN